jgi:GntR family transcriptional regulator
MTFDIDPADTRPIYVQVMDEIRRGIVVGTWREDEMLPSVRQLAVELRINPNTVQQAYRELERDGAVYVRRGQGTFVARREGGGERARMLASLTQRMLQEGWRHGFEVEELLAGLAAAAERERALRNTEERTE